MQYLLDSQYAALTFFLAAPFLLTQIYKLLGLALGLRHYTVFERTLSAFPVLSGLAIGACYGDIVGLAATVQGSSVPTILGGVYGAIVGYASSRAFRYLVERLSGSSKLYQLLTVQGAEE